MPWSTVVLAGNLTSNAMVYSGAATCHTNILVQPIITPRCWGAWLATPEVPIRLLREVMSLKLSNFRSWPRNVRATKQIEVFHQIVRAPVPTLEHRCCCKCSPFHHAINAGKNLGSVRIFVPIRRWKSAEWFNHELHGSMACEASENALKFSQMDIWIGRWQIDWWTNRQIER